MKHLQQGWVFLLVVVACTGTLPAQTHVDRNVVYGMYSGLALLMDVHYPERSNGYAIICVPGSGWNAPLGYDASQLKEDSELDDWAEQLLAGGYTLFFVNHRASPRFAYPAAVEDLQRAVRFVRGSASKYGIHADQIGGLGASSGGHLVSMLGVLDGTGDSDDPDAVNRLSSKLQCVVALFAPSDLKAVRTVRGGPAVALFVGARNLLTDKTPPTTLEYKRYAQASPLTYVSHDDASFLLLHGDADEVVPFEQSQLMEKALQKAGVPVKLIRISGGNHNRNFGLSSGDSQLRSCFAEAANWFDDHLRKDSR